uniref:Uncharacterized protein n=1 Tax=Pakpunavirus sp. TaxID=2833053 RepID=A0AB39BYN6_9CAUD
MSLSAGRPPMQCGVVGIDTQTAEMPETGAPGKKSSEGLPCGPKGRESPCGATALLRRAGVMPGHCITPSIAHPGNRGNPP